MTDLQSNYEKVTRADIARYIDAYIKNKPRVAGIIINAEMNKMLNPAQVFKGN